MSALPPELAAALPWIVALAILAIIAVLLLRRGARLQTALDDAEQARARSTAEQAALGERLQAAQQDAARLTAELERREEAARAAGAAAETRIEALRGQAGKLESEVSRLTAELGRVPELSTELATERERLAALQATHARLESEHAALTTRAREQLNAAQEKIALLEQAETRLTREFENLANRIFEAREAKFSQTSKAGLEALLNPVREQLGEFRKKVEDIYDAENRDRASLRAEITLLKSMNERISDEALNLTRALKGDAKLRGNWGEVQLERVLEQSGLVRGREYEIQASYKSEDGNRFQPDVVVHLPESKDVIIDSKVSLVAYEQYHAAEDDAQRDHHAEQHIASLRAHVSGLAAKSYDDLIGVNSLDLVIMFVPIEPALLLALERQPALFEEALAKSILLVSPSTLMGTLRIIHNIWRHEHQNRNTQEIARQAAGLYDAFVNFIDSLEKVGTLLDRARDEYETAHKRLTSGKGNLVGRAERLIKLGVKAKKALPQELLEDAGESGPDDDDAGVEALPVPRAEDTP
ncbi:MAG: DNA recombination protein RmuC [Gammaproteobacteria bacterium]|nr:DNA recombination protein RmuC [Gammaproteobacteria bacterium]MCP5200808.1 DNA recombination protein RmuC [Gammaproteobacteria bacterium]